MFACVCIQNSGRTWETNSHSYIWRAWGWAEEKWGLREVYIYLSVYFKIYAYIFELYECITWFKIKIQKQNENAHPGQTFSDPFPNTVSPPLFHVALSPVPTFFSDTHHVALPSFMLHFPAHLAPSSSELFEGKSVSFILVSPAHSAAPDVWQASSTWGSESGKREEGGQADQPTLWH